MTDKEKVWLAEYLKCWNATEAARRAKYAWPDKEGAKKKAKFADEIQAHVAEIQMDADEVLRRLAEHARANIGEYINVLPGGQAIINLEKAKKAGALHLIKRLKVTRAGPEIELYDQQAALNLIGKHLGLFKDATTNFNIDMSQLTVEQLERIAKGEDVYHVLATSSAGGA